MFMEIKKSSTEHLHVLKFSRQEITEFFLWGQCDWDTDCAVHLRDAFDYLNEHNARIVHFRIFCVGSLQEIVTAYYKAQFDALPCPVTWIRQPETSTAYPMSVQIHAVRGAKVESVTSDGHIAGCCFEDTVCRYAMVHVLPGDKSQSGFEQTADVFGQMQTLLNSHGMDFSNTLRTWLFADDILSWYDQLNRARDAFFTEHDIFKKLVPASTGVGAANPAGTALTAELLAACPKAKFVTVEKIHSPLQCEALDYKSSFSRAVKLTAPDHCRMYVSGTASIAQGGETVFLNDTARQIQHTMDVIEALIQNGGMKWTDTVRSIAYFKDSGDFALFDAWCRKAEIALPHIKIEADVCRHDLLFELEIELLSRK